MGDRQQRLQASPSSWGGCLWQSCAGSPPIIQKTGGDQVYQSRDEQLRHMQVPLKRIEYSQTTKDNQEQCLLLQRVRCRY